MVKYHYSQYDIDSPPNYKRINERSNTPNIDRESLNSNEIVIRNDNVYNDNLILEGNTYGDKNK